ncbi:MAG: hypothetical protein BZ151_05655 [Desulfobacca sp. 4484_104]|nr:MAG: hypothetical protein BZ151_05655 [Desulfobacca sp. 4484_104]
MKVRSIVIAVLILLALVILFQNPQVVTLHLLLWEISISQIIFTVATLIIGFVLGFIVTRILTKPHIETTTEKMTSVDNSP